MLNSNKKTRSLLGLVLANGFHVAGIADQIHTNRCRKIERGGIFRHLFSVRGIDNGDHAGILTFICFDDIVLFDPKALSQSHLRLPMCRLALLIPMVLFVMYSLQAGL